MAADIASVHQILVVRLSGDLIEGSALTVAEDLRAATARLTAATQLVIDLRAVHTFTAAGARMVLQVARSVADRGIRCSLVADPTSVTVETLTIADPGTTVALHADVEQAIADRFPDENAERGTAMLAEHVEALTRTLLSVSTVGTALAQIVETASAVIPGADLVSVTMRAPDGEFVTPVETDPVASALDQLQYRTGQGPCVEAALPEGPGYVVSDDLGGEQRWSEFTAATMDHGFHAVLSTEILRPDSSGQLSGALNIYSRRPRSFTAADRYTALLLTTHASLALAHTGAVERAGIDVASLRRAIDSRDVIGQAKGILMNRQGITADEAFTLLRQTSQNLNVKLVELAHTLSERHSDLDPT